MALALRLAGAAGRALPWAAAVRAGRVLGRVVQLCGWRASVVRANLARAFPRASAAWRARVAREAYETLAAHALVMWKTPQLRSFAEIRRRFAPLQIPAALTAALNEGGVVVLSAHWGLWELLPAVFAPPVVPARRVVVAAAPLHDAAADAAVRAHREQFGARVVPARGSLPALQTVLGERGGVALLLADQRPSRGGLPATLFGQQTEVFAGATVLHERTGRPVWFAAVSRSLSLILRPVPSPIAQGYASVLTALVEESPGEYMWQHRRFVA